MRIAKVIGTVTLSKQHPSLDGAVWRLAVPLSLENLRGNSQTEAESFAVYDELSAGLGSLIAVSEGAEAAQPFYPNVKPIDAYNAAILDHLEIQPK